MVSKKQTTRHEKKVLDMALTEVFVAHNARHRAYIEQFSFPSVNFTQKHLGTLCGFFIVRDKSQWSAHVVNFLAAEIKKEYFAVSKRKIGEAFEAALHHGNRALAELAKNDNVEWIGTVDGVVCAFDDNEIYFSVTGDAHILLVRDGELMLLSEGLASEHAAENPLKTFVDTASGALQPGDKIIITSRELLGLVSHDELERNATHFSKENFAQFISTILTNECQIAAATIIDISEKTVYEPLRTAASEEDAEITLPQNAFGASTFTDKEDASGDALSDIPTCEHEDASMNDEYTDKRTGHIYLRGDNSDLGSHPTRLRPFFDQAKDVVGDVSYVTRKHTRRLRQKTSAKIVRAPHYIITLIHRVTPGRTPRADRVQRPPSDAIIAPATPSRTHALGAALRSGIMHTGRGIAISGRIIAYAARIGFVKCARVFHRTPQVFRKEHARTAQTSANDTQNVTRDANTPHGTHSLLATLVPHPRNISTLWHAMSPVTRWVTLGFLVFIIVVPLLFNALQNRRAVTVTPERDLATQDTAEQPPETTIAILPVEDRITAVSNTITLASAAAVRVIATPESITLVDADNQTETLSLPDDAGTLTAASMMDDLELLFFITDTDKLYSFSPITKEFNTQKLPQSLDHTQIRAIGTFLTYLYIVRDDTITRYARITGGFDTPITWFEDGDFTNLTALAIDGNVYSSHDGMLDVYFNRAKKEVSLPDGVTASLVYARDGMTYVWILDAEHGKILSLNKDTLAIEGTHDQDGLANAQSFTVDEATNHATIATADGVYTVTLN